MYLLTALLHASRRYLWLGVIIILGVVSLRVIPIFVAAPIYLPIVTGPAAPTTPPTLTLPTKGIWISSAELAKIPTTGLAWDTLKATADSDPGAPTLFDQESKANTTVLAKALVFARTGEQHYRTEVVDALKVITFDHTEDGGRVLALGRELAAYVIAADLIDLPGYDPTLDSQFRQKLRELLTEVLDGDTLQSIHERRPNNWGTHAGASRAAVAVYLGDKAELERTATVFHGYLGDYAAYANFTFGGDLSWQADEQHPVGVNPVGARKEGHSIDGALPEEMRRGGGFQWLPIDTPYPWEGLQGAVVQAEILHRAGYPTWEWEDKALLRAVQFLYKIGWAPVSDDEWTPCLINFAYQTKFPMALDAKPGKNMGWTCWTHVR